jgi:hypothetical protein
MARRLGIRFAEEKVQAASSYVVSSLARIGIEDTHESSSPGLKSPQRRQINTPSESRKITSCAIRSNMQKHLARIRCVGQAHRAANLSILLIDKSSASHFERPEWLDEDNLTVW